MEVGRLFTITLCAVWFSSDSRDVRSFKFVLVRAINNIFHVGHARITNFYGFPVKNFT